MCMCACAFLGTVALCLECCIVVFLLLHAPSCAHAMLDAHCHVYWNLVCRASSLSFPGKERFLLDTPYLFGQNREENSKWLMDNDEGSYG